MPPSEAGNPAAAAGPVVPEVHMAPAPAAVDWPVWVVAAVALAAAVLYRDSYTASAERVSVISDQIHLVSPAGWAGSLQEDGSYVIHPPALEAYPPTLRVLELGAEGEDPAPEEEGAEEATDSETEPSVTELANQVRAHRRSMSTAYRVLQTRQTKSFGGHPALWTYYATVLDPPGTLPGDAVVPLVVIGVDIVVRPSDGKTFLVEAHLAASDFSAFQQSELPAVLDSLVIAP